MKKEKIITVVFSTLMLCLMVCDWFLPKNFFIEHERRYAQSMENLNLSTVLSGAYMDGFEKNRTDLFPFRKDWHSLKNIWWLDILQHKDVNGIYKEGEYLFKVDYPYCPQSVTAITKKLNSILKKNHVAFRSIYYSIIPDKSWYSSSYALKYDFKEMENDFKDKMMGTYIPLSDSLSLDSFYKTDPHWRQEKLIPLMDRLGQSMDFSITDPFLVSKPFLTNFSGAYAGQYGLKTSLDSISCVYGKNFKNYQAYDDQSNKEIPIYNKNELQGKDPYSMYLNGPSSLIRIENPQASKKKNLIIFRDSFASSLAPLLLEAYSNITLVDIRYAHADVLEQYLDFDNCDVLCLYSAYSLNHSELFK